MDRTRGFVDRLVGWSPVLLLGSLAALTYWLDAQVQTPAAREDGSKRHDPDLFLQDFRAQTFDAQGRLREELSARRAEHFPDDDSSELISPKLMLTETGRPTMTITANKGSIAGDRNSGAFQGAVKVTRDADPNPPKDGRPSGPVTLTTDSLHVLAKEQRVDTDAPVTIEEPRGIIHGRGLTFDNKARTVIIKSQISGSFQPQEPAR
ncbi:MAG TPA: LPS export ABC transporter periplasmic protein LptC [Casimicrobiaceae bacterium]|nr:LPS export ABC transporter periplasmic protein LptC [Casimicrobiaceae bacterium]